MNVEPSEKSANANPVAALKLARVLNALAIDAVLVALVWQALFSISIADQWPRPAQSAALGSTVWLIYVADRLLDAKRLKPEARSTYRHNFHLRHRRRLTIVWMFVLALDALVICFCIDESVRLLGMGVAVAVLVYGASVHFQSELSGMPKEIQVGVLFAIGTSLIVWPQHGGSRLLWSVCLASVLFTLNCILVASREIPWDRAQGFTSWPLRDQRIEKMLPLLLAALIVNAAILAVLDAVPIAIASSIVLSGLAMLWLSWSREKLSRCVAGFVADGTLVLAPICLWPLFVALG